MNKIPVLIDTREQRPWEFDSSMFEPHRATLTAGDYSVCGLEGQLAIERKSLGDFVSTVIADWLRFRKELYRLASYDVAAIVVEADVADVFNHRYESDAQPASVIGKANSIFLDHSIPVLWWGPRETCVAMAERFIYLAHKKLGGLS